MTLREQLIAVTDRYSELTGRSRARVSNLVLNSGHQLDSIASGKDLNTATFERAMAWLSANWPAGEKWPDGVKRPKEPAQ